MYVIRLTCFTTATMIPANTLTLCYSIWAADPYTGTLHGYQMLMQVVACGGWRVYQLAVGVYAPVSYTHLTLPTIGSV